MCLKFRALNKATIRNNYPLPRINEVWDQIGASHVFSTVDLRYWYNQIRIASEDTQKTCFRTWYGAYEFLMVPFGLAGAPPIFQSLMNEVLRPYLDNLCLVYLDDILIYSRDEKKHLDHIRLVLENLREHRLLMGLGMVVDRRLPPSSRHHESGVWQGLYRIEVEVVWILRGATGI
jgi:Reverse transcriptase (RNA-dependent DNA polymerase)